MRPTILQITHWRLSMAKIESIIEGLQIQAKYKPDDWCAAEHDVFYGTCTSETEMSDADKARLEEIGWFICSEVDTWAVYT